MRHPMRSAAAVVIAAVGLIHLYLAPEYLDSHVAIGVLFVLAGAGSAFVAVRLWYAGGQLAWLLGAAISVCTFAGFVLSRTVGLLGFEEHEWELLGIVSLVVEGTFVALFAVREQPVVARALASPVDASSERRRDRGRLTA